ncbi:DUF3987 domain-containing protein [Solemya elarraichensis gill symbiont]|nr:DUF3987 domain-containing protein [Solemya elarraichensis gill symbiont]
MSSLPSESTVNPNETYLGAGIPQELFVLADEPIWGYFEIPTGQKKRPGKGRHGYTHQSCTNPDTLYSLEEVQAELDDKRVLTVSLKLASKKLGRLFSIKDLDAYKEGFDQDLLEYYLNEQTFIDISPSGQGYHVWYSYNIKPTVTPKQVGVDNVTGFITLTGNVYKDESIAEIDLDHSVLRADKEYAPVQLIKDGKQSVIAAFNATFSIDQIFSEYGYTSKGQNRWRSPDSGTGTHGVVVFPSNRGDYSVAYSHHASMGELHERVFDAYDLAAFHQYPSLSLNEAKSEYARELMHELSAIDPETGEKTDQTIAEYNRPKRREFGEFHVPESDPIDIRHFPNVLIQAAEEVADWTKTGAVYSAVLCGVQVTSALLGKNVKIHEMDDLVHPCSMGVFIGASSGGRKSEIFKKMGEPFFKFEEQLQEKWDNQQSGNQVVKTAYQNQIKALQKFKKGATPEEILKGSTEAIALQVKIDQLNSPKPFFISEDITEEKLVRVLDAQNTTQAIFSDDARNMIRNISGMRRDDGSGENIYLKGLTNGDYVYSRVGSDGGFKDIVLRRICLNIFGFVQLDLIEQLLAKEGYITSGMAARFWIYIQGFDPINMLENAENRPLNQKLMQPYYDKIRSLCVVINKPINIHLSNEAKQYWRELNNQVAQRLKTDWSGNYDSINKIVTLSAKMATVFLALRTDDFMSKAELEIPLDVYQSACEFVLFLTDQNLQAMRAIKSSAIHNKARKLSDRADNDKKIQRATYGAIRKNVAESLRDDLSEILKVLIDYGHYYRDGDEYVYVKKMR